MDEHDEQQIEPVEGEPQFDPAPPEPEEPTTIPVVCGNPECGEHYEFPSHEDGRRIDSFSFQCGKCGAQNTWSRT